MRLTLLRIAKNGGLVAVGLFIFGMMFAQIAQMWFIGNLPPRNGPIMESSVTQKVATDQQLANGLRWRLPVSMAGWGFLLVAGYETLAGIWRGHRQTTESPKPTSETGHPGTNESEEAIQKLLNEMEVKETNLANTPAPVGQIQINAAIESKN